MRTAVENVLVPVLFSFPLRSQKVPVPVLLVPSRVDLYGLLGLVGMVRVNGCWPHGILSPCSLCQGVVGEQ